MLKEKKFLKNLFNQLERTEGKSPLVERKGKELHDTSSLGCLKLPVLDEGDVSLGILSSGSKHENTSQTSHATSQTCQKVPVSPSWTSRGEDNQVSAQCLLWGHRSEGDVQPLILFHQLLLLLLNSVCPNIQALQRK